MFQPIYYANLIYYTIVNRQDCLLFINLLMLISSLLAIFFIFKLASFFRQVYENRGEGIITAILGFSGSLLVMFGWQNNFQLIVI